MAAYLSQADVEKLMKEPSPLARAEVAAKLGQEIDNPQLSASEVAMAHDIVRLMARDVEMSVRESLAQNLRRAVRLPHDVALQLARDVEAVALPILQESTVLTDQDLISIVQAGSPQKHEAIASRENVSAEVSEAIITNAGEGAVAKLMQNNTATISENSFNKAIDRFQASEDVKDAIVKREVLPVTVAERLTYIVSSQLQDYLVSHHELSPTVAADLVLQSRERTIVNMSHGEDEEDIEKLVQQMFQNNRLTSSIVLRALCVGDLPFFEAAIAIRGNIPLTNARILIHDAGHLGLKTLYEKAGMPANLLPIVRAALDVLHNTEMSDEGKDAVSLYRACVLERILTQFEHLASDDIDYLVAKLGDILTPASVA